MSILKRRQPAPPKAAVQLRREQTHPFGALESYVPLTEGEMRLYRSIREAVPVIDAAIIKLVRLVGGFTVRCPSQQVTAQLQHFLNTVPTGRGQRGADSFLTCYLDSLLTCGAAVGEVALTAGGREIAALLCGSMTEVEFRQGRTPLDFILCSRGITAKPFPRQDLLLFTPLNPEPERPYGVSLLRSMPFLTEILLKIYAAIGKNWERMGNVRFAVTYRPEGDRLDRTLAAERGEQIAAEWSRAMQNSRNGSVCDFVAVGNVEIKAIGADNQVLDSEVPVRQILEQLVARTGLPPFLLGLHWSTTERMSSQQADLMTSELWAIRRSVTPVLERVCELWLRLHGYDPTSEIIWDEINMQDLVQQAQARLYNAQAEKLERELRE